MEKDTKSENKQLNETVKKNVDIIVNQTDYDESKAEEKLIQHNNNIVKVIEEYLNITNDKPKKSTINQQIYTEIRNFMDTSCKNYYK